MVLPLQYVLFNSVAFVRFSPSELHRLRGFELEFELIETQMAQKPIERAEVYASSLCASQNEK